MTRKKLFASGDDLIALYKTGLNSQQIADKFGVKQSTVLKRMREAGFSSFVDGHHLSRFDVGSAHSAHLSGDSILSISQRIGVSRDTIYRRFAENGLHWRGMSQAQSERFSKTTKEYNKRICASAQAARRGQAETNEIKSKRALAMAKAKTRVGLYERELLQCLRDAGVDCDIQHNVGRYNVDIFIHSPAVAVEIYSSHPCSERIAQIRERTKYILNQGVSQLTIQVTYPRRVWIESALRDDVITFLEFCRLNQSAVGHNRVIRGNGQCPSESSHYLDNFPPVLSF